MLPWLISDYNGPVYKKLRHEFGYVYSISSYIWKGALFISFETDLKNVNAAITQLRSTLKEIGQKGINEIDYLQLRSSIKFGRRKILTDATQLGSAYSRASFDFPSIKTLEEYFEVMDAPTSQSLQDQINSMLKTEPMIIVTK